MSDFPGVGQALPGQGKFNHSSVTVSKPWLAQTETDDDDDDDDDVDDRRSSTSTFELSNNSCVVETAKNNL